MCSEKISVIVPVYNVEKYLKACIESIINQTYVDIEIILIDDGSYDESGNICDKFAIRDNRIIVVHQENCGLSEARNKGLELAQGAYVTFVDSDDYIAPDYIEKLYITLNTFQTQISICDYQRTNENIEFSNINYLISDKITEIRKLSNIDTMLAVYDSKIHGIDFISVAKLYDINLFRDNNITFPKGKLHEDAFTTYRLIYASKNIVYIDKAMYFYRVRCNSITNTKFTLKRIDKLDATRGECEFFLNEMQLEILKVAFYDHLHETRGILKELIKMKKTDNNILKIELNKLKNDIKKFGGVVRLPFKKLVFYNIIIYFPQILLLI